MTTIADMAAHAKELVPFREPPTNQDEQAVLYFYSLLRLLDPENPAAVELWLKAMRRVGLWDRVRPGDIWAAFLLRAIREERLP